MPNSTWTHTISYQLEIMANWKIIVPGLEPVSELSSKVLGAYLARQGPVHPLVDAREVLTVIPGSFIKYGANYSRGGYRQKWLVLPPFAPECPCNQLPDYYAILKSLAKDDLPVEESFDKCDVNGMGYCPHPDFKLEPPPTPDPYQPEGAFPPGVGILPPLPSWTK